MTTTLHGSAKEQILPGEPGSSLLELGPWLTTYDSDAVCNDGTPAGESSRIRACVNACALQQRGGKPL